MNPLISIVRNNVTEVIFVPYAKVNGDYDGYTSLMAGAISKFGKIYDWKATLIRFRLDFRLRLEPFIIKKSPWQKHGMSGSKWKTSTIVKIILQKSRNWEKTINCPFTELATSVKGLHTFPDPVEAIKAAHCIYIGGGNTFVLLKKLYELNLVELIRKRVLEDGIAYMGSSAGSNVATRSIQTTNDMPIAYPPS